MVVTGITALVVVGLLFIWLIVLCFAAWRTYRSTRDGRLTRNALSTVGIILSAIAVLSALLLQLSWLSVDLSQKMHSRSIRLIALFLFWPSIAGFFCCAAGAGRTRLIGIASSLVTGLWWFTLAMGSAISMGALPVTRHPVDYLIPHGYTGWIRIKRGEAAPPLPIEGGSYVCRIPPGGVMSTSSLAEEGWAHDRYFYYGDERQKQELQETGWGKGGMIWGGMTEVESAQDGSRPTKMIESVFVGTEEQYRHSTGNDLN